MNYFLLLLFLINTSVRASDCYIISGFERDVDNTFDIFNYKKNSIEHKFKHMKCTVVKSWKSFQIKMKTKSEHDKSKVLVFQIAHGGASGVCGSDDGNESAADVLQVMNNVSRDRKLGVVNLSCYSGDLLAHKIANDLKNPSSKSVDNLCLITATSFGNVGVLSKDNYKLLYDFNPTKQSLIDLYIKTSGMLTSASPWSEKKTVEALSQFYLNESIDIFESINNTNYLDRKFCIKDQEVLNGKCALGINYLSRFIFWTKRLPIGKKFLDYVPKEYEYWREYLSTTTCPANLVSLMHEIAHTKIEISELDPALLLSLNKQVSGKRNRMSFNRILSEWSKAKLLDAKEKSLLDKRRNNACANF